MAANVILRSGPVALTTTTTTNILNGNVTSLAGPVGITLTQPKLSIKSIHVVNKTGVAATFSLWLGATGANAAGTEIFSAYNVPANSAYDWAPPGGLPLLSTDFLVGGAGTATALTFEAAVEVGF